MVLVLRRHRGPRQPAVQDALHHRVQPPLVDELSDALLEHGLHDPLRFGLDEVIETVAGIGFDVLLVCGFAFDPHVSEDVKNYCKITVIPVKMNPDLTMGDEVLKKTGAGNLFMVFGEPDLDLKKHAYGTVEVELRGLDSYDPTTGAIRSSTTDDIACWFIDTDYNG